MMMKRENLEKRNWFNFDAKNYLSGIFWELDIALFS